MTFSIINIIATVSILTLRIAEVNLKTILYIMDVITTASMKTHSIMTHRITAHTIVTLSIMNVIATVSINDSQSKLQSALAIIRISHTQYKDTQHNDTQHNSIGDRHHK